MKIIEMLDKMATGEISTKAKVKYGNARYKHKNWESLDYYIYQEFGKRYESEIKDFLNDEIEILDEEEFETIEELLIEYDDGDIGINKKYISSQQSEIFAKSINQLIKNQKKIIERLK